MYIDNYEVGLYNNQDLKKRLCYIRAICWTKKAIRKNLIVTFSQCP